MHAPCEEAAGVLQQYEYKTSPDTGSLMKENRRGFLANFLVQ